MEQLAELRAQIDQLDQELLQLLAKRLDVVHKVGEVKQRHGLPIYVPQREIEMLQRKREAAEQLGLSPDLIEDILRRIMRESYVSENRFGFKTVNPDIRKIVIVGSRQTWAFVWPLLARFRLSCCGVGTGGLASGREHFARGGCRDCFCAYRQYD